MGQLAATGAVLSITNMVSSKSRKCLSVESYGHRKFSVHAVVLIHEMELGNATRPFGEIKMK